MRRCDSAAIVPNTSELLPEPETPVKTVSRRFGISMLMSLRLFARAPYTRIRSWLSAACSGRDCVLVFMAMLIVSPPGSVYQRRTPKTNGKHADRQHDSGPLAREGGHATGPRRGGLQ